MLFALSDGRGRFAISAAPAATADARRGAVRRLRQRRPARSARRCAPTGRSLFRNLGGRWADVTRARVQRPRRGARRREPVALARRRPRRRRRRRSRDQRHAAALRDAGATTAATASDRCACSSTARVSNRSGVGAKVEMRAGSLRQRLETYVGDARAGAGRCRVRPRQPRRRADVVRVLWPSGILQAETATGDRAAATACTATLTITELDRKPSSCPYLYTWNGTRFEFVTDFLGGGEMGYWQGPGVRNTPDPDEYVRIDGDAAAAARRPLRAARHQRAGRSAVPRSRCSSSRSRIPADVEVYPERRAAIRRADRSGSIAARDARPPLRAIDEHGHDVLDADRAHRSPLSRRLPRSRDPRLRRAAHADARPRRRGVRRARAAADRLDRLRVFERQRRRASARPAR